MATKTVGRGSAKLSTATAGLKAKLKNVKIIDWRELGTPVEFITGTVQVPYASYKTTLATLSKLKELRDLHILINGTPRPDIAQIKFSVQG